jgi:hypothetical protein
MLQLSITWQAPYTPERVVAQLNDGGDPPAYGGKDYGLYQIYGRHILGDPDALLYIGEATEQTFSERFSEHQTWLVHEDPVRVYIGRLYTLPSRHAYRDNWATWTTDVLLAERILIYKYSPHYNCNSIADPPALDGHDKVVLLHGGHKNRLYCRDVAPDDWY